MPGTMHSLHRPLAACLLAGGLILGPVAAASAHVTVHPDSTAPGSWSQLTFRVPDESAGAATTKLVVTLPQDEPFGSVSVRPVTGWTASVKQARLPEPVHRDGATITRAAHTVTWTATPGHGIKPGQYQEFALSVGPLPDGGTITLPAIQYYSDGTVVKWAERTTRGAAEPDHPAPTVTIGAAAPAADSASTSTDTTSRWLAGAALALGVIAVALAGVAALRPRRGRTTTRTIHPTEEPTP